jgi:DNA modification methylase
MTVETATPFFTREGAELYHGDCLSVLPTLPAESVDSVVTDPPYPEIDRPYGRMTEADWRTMMHAAVKDIRRVLKPTGSAVFILQPNSERVGRMRGWLWEFQAWLVKEWAIVQDAWWYNPQAMPTVHCQQSHGLMRPSLKACVWAGPHDCYRNQDAVLIEPAESTKKDKRVADNRLKRSPSTHGMRHARSIGGCLERGGATPFNVLTIGRGGGNGHSAETPLALCEWWVKYLTPPGGTVLDPFAGSATTGEAALKHGYRFVGIERDEGYAAIAKDRLAGLSFHTGTA